MCAFHVQALLLVRQKYIALLKTQTASENKLLITLLILIFHTAGLQSRHARL